MYADASTDRTDTELNKFYEIEKNKYKDIDDFMGKANGNKSTTEEVNMIETSGKGKQKKASKKKSKNSKSKNSKKSAKGKKK